MVSPGTPLIGEPGSLIHHQSPDGRLEIRRAIMSSFPAEAIVNATDKFMTINTANVRGAEHQIIHAAGSELRNHLLYNYHFGLPVGDALATSSFEARNCWYIIHVNGPDFESRRRYVMPLLKQQLADCYRRCMEEAFRLGVKSIAFPCIGTGLMGWPRCQAARIGVATVSAWLRHCVYGEARRAVIERVTFLADPVGRQAHQEQAWCAAFREFWPRVLLPRRANRVSFLDYVDRQETRRLERDNNQLVKSQQTVIEAPAPAPAPGQRSPIVTRQVSASRRELRRSRRTGKRPERYGQ